MKPESTGSPGDCTVCSRHHYWPSVSCGKSSSLLTGGMSPTLWNRLHTHTHLHLKLCLEIYMPLITQASLIFLNHTWKGGISWFMVSVLINECRTFFESFFRQSSRGILLELNKATFDVDFINLSGCPIYCTPSHFHTHYPSPFSSSPFCHSVKHCSSVYWLILHGMTVFQSQPSRNKYSRKKNWKWDVSLRHGYSNGTGDVSSC